MAPKTDRNYIKQFIVDFVFPLQQPSNTRYVAVITAGGLFINLTKKEDVDALTLLTSFKIMLISQFSLPLSRLQYGIKKFFKSVLKLQKS